MTGKRSGGRWRRTESGRDKLLSEAFDCPGLNGVWSDEELDGVEQILELLVVLADFSFERENLRGQLFVLTHQVSNTHESPDYVDTHAYSSWRVEHRSQHNCKSCGRR